MARTRGASGVIHTDDGELLDKEGKPIPTGAATWSGVSQQANPDATDTPDIPFPEGPHPDPVPEVWRCNTMTVQRNLDGRDLFLLLDLILGSGSLAMDMPGAEFHRLPADLRQHFRRVT